MLKNKQISKKVEKCIHTQGNFIRKNKGITLIALVLTIIVLLILAGISIRILGGENGLITKTKIAKEENKKSEYKEKLSIAKSETIVEKDGQDINLDEYIEQIKADKIDGIKSIEKITNDKAKIITEEGFIFIITVNTIEDYENEDNTPDISIKDANIEFSFDPNTWTNSSVKVTVTQKENKYVIQLSKDAINWKTTNKIEFTENGVVYARVKDSVGRVSDYASRKISIIDKEKPVVTEAISNTNNVKLKATDDAAGIVGYAVTTIDVEPTEFKKCNSMKSLDVTIDGLTQGTTYYAWVKDAAGNVSASRSTSTGNVTELEIKVNTTNWSTSKTITIKATNSNYSNIRYTTDGTIPTSTTGTAYTAAFKVTKNCTVTAVAFDNAGQAGTAATNKVTTIDKTVPTVSTALTSTSQTTNSISLSIGVTDTNSGLGKIDWYYGTTNNPTTKAGTTSITAMNTNETGPTTAQTKTYTVTGLATGTTYYFKAVVYDVAGNQVSSTVISAKTNKDIGDEVTVGGEQFYVLNWDNNLNTVDLISKYNLNRQGTAQQNAKYGTTACAFSSTNYWSSSFTSTPFNLNDFIGYTATDAIGKAKSYGRSKGAVSSRLLSLEEASALSIKASSNTKINTMLLGKANSANGFLYYWLGSAYSTDLVWRVNGNGGYGALYSDTFRSPGLYGVRPVITILKSKIS